MTTAKEIADALRTAKDFADIAPLTAWTSARESRGVPVALENALATAMVNVFQLRRRLSERLAGDAEEARGQLAMLGNGGVVRTLSLAQQSNHTAVVLAAESAQAADAARALLDVFAAIGDRIEATPEEQAKAAAERAERAERETVIRRSAWEKLPVKRLRDAAKWRGLDVDGDKPTLAKRLVDAGMVPEQASE